MQSSTLLFVAASLARTALSCRTDVVNLIMKKEGTWRRESKKSVLILSNSYSEEILVRYNIADMYINHL